MSPVFHAAAWDQGKGFVKVNKIAEAFVPPRMGGAIVDGSTARFPPPTPVGSAQEFLFPPILPQVSLVQNPTPTSYNSLVLF